MYDNLKKSRCRMDKQEYLTLWTRQVPQVCEEIMENGVYIVKEEYIREKNKEIAPYYLRLYSWFTKRAACHLKLEPEHQYPIWLSVDEDNMLQLAENTVVLKVEIPREQVLICNYDAWGYCVNYWYIPSDEEDAKRHADELKKYGISSDDELFLTDKGNFYPLLKQKVIKSWERVFSLEPRNKQEMVAVSYELRREWVREVFRYEG